jgi:catechol 2,3-dioxygenase-like lactoylglutathione lyase family enzyme
VEPDWARHALCFGSQKLNLHAAAGPWEPHARVPKPGTADLCFVTDVPVAEVVARFGEAGVEVLEGGGPVDRVGAMGRLRSVYVRDPDGNLVELVCHCWRSGLIDLGFRTTSTKHYTGPWKVLF